jgi:S-adenosylmethionine:tRNA ribosyltransferase-isomerase
MISNRIKDISVKDFTYNLPVERIAKYALAGRDQSKLLVWENGKISDDNFYNLTKYLSSATMLVFNNTKVIKARLIFRKKTGARIELFCLEPILPSDYSLSFSQTENCRWKCIIGNLKKWKDEALEKRLTINGQIVIFRAEKMSQIDDAHEILFSWDNHHYSFGEIIEAFGDIPIPPYLNRESEKTDLTSYQTVYSKINGSVAAPTAGLHFTTSVLDSLKKKGIKCEEITLHVGAGTFQPVKSATISGHKMHEEHFTVSIEFIEKLSTHKGKIIAVGTTSVRTLESLYWMGSKIIDYPSAKPADLAITQWEAYHYKEQDRNVHDSFKSLLDFMLRNNIKELNTSTKIIIIPGYEFKVIDGMVTNFHQPKSTLLLLIAAFLRKEWRRIYDHALSNNYRFLSYGDSNLYLK